MERVSGVRVAALVACLTVLVAVGDARSPRVRARDDLGPWVPRSFAEYRPMIEKRYYNRQEAEVPIEDDVIDEDLIDCTKMVKPEIPTSVPSWAEGESIAGLEELTLTSPAIYEIINNSTALATGAFVYGSEIVIKECTRSAVESVAAVIKPKTNPANGVADPQFDIYFDCPDKTKTYTIYVKQTWELGKSGSTTSGRYRIFALDKNVKLDGGNQYRIMKIMRKAEVLVYGVTFARGRTGDGYGLTIDNLPSGGYGGAGIQVSIQAALRAVDCRFTNNKVESAFARWGGGAAIKLETGAFGAVWGCYFAKNDAAVGGAIGTSSARVLQVADSQFSKNVARGGMDDNGDTRDDDKTNNPLKLKRVILVRGAAIRIDSGDDDGLNDADEHVLLCGSEFTENRLEFKTADLVDKFGYEPDEWFYVRAAGAAATLWNAPRNLDDVSDNQHFVSVKDCSFKRNTDAVEPVGDFLGRYVLEWMGAGHFAIEGCEFRGNTVQQAVLRVDNSERWLNTVVQYGSIMKDLQFRNNIGIYNVDFKLANYSSQCEFRNVEGIPDGIGDCKEQLQAADNSSILEDDTDGIDVIDPDDPDAPVVDPEDPVVVPTTPPPIPDEDIPADANEGYVPCVNTWGINKCEGLVADSKCTEPETASNCVMSCGMCRTCIDYNEDVCGDVVRLDRCGERVFQEKCPAACNRCNATPTPTPLLPDVPADYPLCTNIRGSNSCANVLAKGNCAKLTAASECNSTCGVCPVCTDYDQAGCAIIVAYGMCSDPIQGGKCALSCDKCNPLPGAPPTPAPTPDPNYVYCTNTLGNTQCEKRRDAGRCVEQSTSDQCHLACGSCPVCVDFSDEYCANAAAVGECSKRAEASKCPSSCGLCG